MRLLGFKSYPPPITLNANTGTTKNAVKAEVDNLTLPWTNFHMSSMRNGQGDMYGEEGYIVMMGGLHKDGFTQDG